MKYLLPTIALALTGSAGFILGRAHEATLAIPTQYSALSLNGGNDAQCQDYRLGAIASPQEIASMLADASQGAAQSGCVNLIVEGE